MKPKTKRTWYHKNVWWILGLCGLFSGLFTTYIVNNDDSLTLTIPGLIFALFLTLPILFFHPKPIWRIFPWIICCTISYYAAIITIICTGLIVGPLYTNTYAFFIGGTIGGLLMLLSYWFIEPLPVRAYLILSLLGGAISYLMYINNNETIFTIWQIGMALGIGISIYIKHYSDK